MHFPEENDGADQNRQMMSLEELSKQNSLQAGKKITLWECKTKWSLENQLHRNDQAPIYVGSVKNYIKRAHFLPPDYEQVSILR